MSSPADNGYRVSVLEAEIKALQAQVCSLLLRIEALEGETPHMNPISEL